MGDFNCKVGGLNTTYPKAIGKHTPGVTNARGRLLAKFCVRNALVATNTIFKKRKHFTWISPDGRTKNQIDFILTRHNTPRQTIVDCSVLNYPDISDHRLVRANIKLKFSWPQKQKSQWKYDLDSLKNADIKNLSSLNLATALPLYQACMTRKLSTLRSHYQSMTLWKTIFLLSKKVILHG